MKVDETQAAANTAMTATSLTSVATPANVTRLLRTRHPVFS